MKIDNSTIYGLGAGSGIADEKQPVSNQQGPSFAEQLSGVLQQALIEVTSKDKTEDAKPDDLQDELLKNQNGIVAINNKVAMNQVEKASVPPAQQSVNALDDLLATLEEYEARLADPKTSLKELSPLVNNMQTKASALEADLPLMDSSISPLANQIIGQAQIEAIKFNRGDYI